MSPSGTCSVVHYNTTPLSSQAASRKKKTLSMDPETYETIPEVFGSSESVDLPTSSEPRHPPMPHSRKRSGQSAEAQMTMSLTTTSLSSLQSNRSSISESDSVFMTQSVDTHAPLPSPPLMNRSPILQRKALRPTCSHSDVSPTSSLINERPPCPVPKAAHLSHSNSAGGIGVSSPKLYQHQLISSVPPSLPPSLPSPPLPPSLPRFPLATTKLQDKHYFPPFQLSTEKS